MRAGGSGEKTPQRWGGRVLETGGGIYRVEVDGQGEIEASLRGRLKQVARTGDRVVPGDLVVVSVEEPSGGWTIEDVEGRQNQLVRASAGGRKAKVVAANLQRVVVVFSACEPPFDLAAADRFLVLAEACRIPPVLILNKMDLPGAQTVAERLSTAYEGTGYTVLPMSARTGEGLERLRPLFSAGVSALIGPSGVGKSSIMNALYPGLDLRTARVTRRGSRGRHTTVGACLLPLMEGGWVADTPGFSEVNLWEVGSDELSNAFPEFREPSELCRFRGCTHSHEPDCAVIEAVEAGKIRDERYRSYRSLLG